MEEVILTAVPLILVAAWLVDAFLPHTEEYRSRLPGAMLRLLLLAGALLSLLCLALYAGLFESVGTAVLRGSVFVLLPALVGIVVRTRIEGFRNIRGVRLFFALAAGIVWGYVAFLIMLMLVGLVESCTAAYLMHETWLAYVFRSSEWIQITTFILLCAAFSVALLWLDRRVRKKKQEPPGGAPHSGEPAARGGP